MKTDQIQTCESLLAVLRRLKMALADLAEDHDLTLVQLFAMYNITHGASTMGKLADSAHCDASTVTGLVDRLMAQDLVMRMACEQDRRTKLLSLTTKGEKIMNDIMVDLPHSFGCDTFTDDELKTLQDLLARVAVV